MVGLPRRPTFQPLLNASRQSSCLKRLSPTPSPAWKVLDSTMFPLFVAFKYFFHFVLLNICPKLMSGFCTRAITYLYFNLLCFAHRTLQWPQANLPCLSLLPFQNLYSFFKIFTPFSNSLLPFQNLYSLLKICTNFSKSLLPFQNLYSFFEICTPF